MAIFQKYYGHIIPLIILILEFFGCHVYVHVNEGKLVPCAVKCIFLGYGSGVKGYRVWCPDPKYRKIIHSRDVTFNEDVITNSDDSNMATSPESQPQTKYLLARDRERRPVNKPPRLEDYQFDLVAYAFAAVAHIKNCEPIHYLEAISSPECDKWVVVKDGIPGVESNRYKARYVVRVFDQHEGIDFNEVFSLVVRHTSIRVLLSIVALQDLELEQLDVKTTFLHGHLEEEIYVEKPEGFKVPGKEDHVCRLKKSLYGLKQSPRQWYKRDQIRELKDQLSNEFDMKDLGAAKMILGMEIQRDRKMASHFKLSSHECPKSEEDKEDMSRVPYSSAVGSLMYAMVCTRPDLAHVISVVSRYMHNPGRASPNEIVGYVDSDYTVDLNARTSLSSYIFSHCGSAISWYSCLQAITALSTTEYDDDVKPESGEGLVAKGQHSDREREGKGNNEKKPKKTAEVAIAKGVSDDGVYLAIDTEKSRDELIVDYGCTFHMIPHRGWCTTYESFNGGNVYMRNHSLCPVIGKDFKRNLISFSTHEANGCKYSSEDGVMKVFKGDLVLMKAIQSGGLYVLQGTVVYGTAGVATSKASLGDSKLCHYCLDHIGEKGKKNLAKKGLIKVSCNQKRKYYGHVIPLIILIFEFFGYHVYVHVNEGKLVPHAVKCIFLGYGSAVKGYRVWCPDPKYRKIIHSRDVTFNEDVIINSGKDFVPPHNVDNNHTEGKVEFEFDVENSTHTQPPFNDEHIETQDDGNMPTSP
nr:retrotransposon protein, putative, Ty1-copia subclass [Tanacetum cinerariifolium]